MTNYTIRIYNQSLANKSYVAFMAPPEVTARGAPVQVYTNAWVTFETITNGGWDSIVYTPGAYAFWGQSRQPLNSGAVIQSGGATPVDVATQDTVTFTNTDVTGFSSLSSPGSAQSGSFSIVSTTDFTPQNGFVFGLAQNNGTPIPAPVATFEALPNEVYNITPVTKFYVADGYCAPGQVVDFTFLSSAATVDFTGLSQTTATIVQNPNGTFTVTFS